MSNLQFRLGFNPNSKWDVLAIFLHFLWSSSLAEKYFCMIQWSRTSLLQQKVLKCSDCLADFLFTWINHVVHENPKCFAKSYYAFLPSKFQFSSWKNFLSSLLSRSMPIVKELEIDFSFFFGSVESLANLSHSSLL